MNIIQATPSIYEPKHVGSARSSARIEQNERVVQPSLSSIVTLGDRPTISTTYNKNGLFESEENTIDGAKKASDILAKEAALDENARLSASIAANAPYAYAVSLLYVNSTTNSYILAKMLPKAISGIQPVSPISSYLSKTGLAH